MLSASALLVFVVPLLLITWPALSSPADTVIGGSFIFGHMWSWDLVTRGILEQGSLLVNTYALNYPDGGSVTLIGWSYILPLTALRAVGCPLVLAVNLLMALHLLLGCYLAFRLALRLTGAWPESVVAGLAYGFCPYVLSLLWNGQQPKLVHGLLPLVLLLVLRVVESRRVWPLVACGAVLALTLASSPYHGMFGALLALAAGLWLLATRPAGERRRALGRLALAALCAAVATAPYFYYWIASQSDPAHPPLLVPAGELRDVYAMHDFNASLSGWFAPQATDPPLSDPHLWNVFHVHYLGWIAVAMALLALGLRLRGRGRGVGPLGPGFFAAAGLGFLLLAHGPTLRLGSLSVPLPLRLLWEVAPVTQAFYITYRAVLVVSLALAVLGAMGLAAALKPLGLRLRGAVCAVAGCAIMAEALLVSPAPFPLKAHRFDIPRAYHDLARRDDCGAVLQVPYEAHNDNIAFELHLFHQSVHSRPLVHGDLKTKLHQLGAFHSGLFQAVTGRASADAPPTTSRPALHFRYAVLHERMVPAGRLPAVRAFLERGLRLVRAYPGEGVRLYETRVDGPYPRAPGLPRRCLR